MDIQFLLCQQEVDAHESACLLLVYTAQQGEYSFLG